jgi:hypothetical protein|tara:strand:+ start:9960 stop:10334 length:375 start_codon:yes stop_codon:yes gene_type:complete
MKILILAIALILGGCTADADHGTPHKITWTPADAAADGFNLYCGTELGIYTTNTLIGGGGVTEIALSIVNLADDNGVNYCTMTAYNFAGESGFSNEIMFGTRNGEAVTLPPGSPNSLDLTLNNV